MKKYDVITSGYVSMDHMLKIRTPAAVGFTSLIENKTNSKIYYGGCSVNIAYALCRLGMKSMPILRVGDDYEEIGFKDFLVNGQVPTDGITRVQNETTSVCYLIQDNNGEHITIFYPGAMDEKYTHPLDDEIFAQSGLGVITVAARSDNEEFFKKCRQHEVPVVFGMKADFDAFPEPFLKELLLYSKIIFTNETERQTIERLFDLHDITDLFALGRTEIIVTTYGKKGSTYYCRQQDNTVDTACIPICDCTEVVDATGSGDSYIAGFLYGYHQKMSIADCCRMGSTLSSFTIEKEGCCTNVPSEEDLMKRFIVFKEYTQ